MVGVQPNIAIAMAVKEVKEVKPVPSKHIVLLCAPPAFHFQTFRYPVYYHLDMSVCCSPFKQKA